MMEKTLSLFSLSKTVVSQLLWGTCLEESEFALACHRDDSQRKITHLALPQKICLLLKQDLLLLEQAYNDAFHWLSIYKVKIHSLRCNKVDLIYDEQYRFSNFLTPLGEFNDLNWVLKFVDDEKQNIFDRFYFACFYCLEKQLSSLWRDERIRASFLKGKLYTSKCNDNLMVKFWIDYFVRNTAEFQISIMEGDSLHFAFKSGDEKAVQYFWNKILAEFRSSNMYCFLLYCLVQEDIFHKGYRKIHQYLWSQLSLQVQKDLLQHEWENMGQCSIWKFYIQPGLILFIPEQIMLHQNVLPPAAYICFLRDLAVKMNEIKSPVYEETFWKVWEVGSEKNKRKFLKNDKGTLLYLFHAKHFACDRFVIGASSFTKKRRVLFKAIEKTLKANELRADKINVRKYLLLYLKDLCRGNRV